MQAPNMYFAIGGPVLMIAGVYMSTAFGRVKMGERVGLAGAFVMLLALISAWS